MNINGLRLEVKHIILQGKHGLASPSLTWAWHSSAQACFISLSTFEQVWYKLYNQIKWLARQSIYSSNNLSCMQKWCNCHNLGQPKMNSSSCIIQPTNLNKTVLRRLRRARRKHTSPNWQTQGQTLNTSIWKYYKIFAINHY